MRNASFALVAAFSLLAFPACGGGDGNDNNNDPDAGGGGGGDIDGGGGGGELTGIGESCGGAEMEMCSEQSAGLCLSMTQGGDGFCSAQCGEAGTVEITTDGEGAISGITGQDDTVCSANYSGGIGTAACVFFLTGTGDLPQEPEPNSTYTADMACGIVCAQTSPQCPGDLSCNANGACTP